jgi:signal transduction histidine kinase
MQRVEDPARRTVRDGSRVSWWAAPGAPPLPAGVEHVLEGRVPGWIVCPLTDGGGVFARVTPETLTQAPVVLRAIGPSLAAGATSIDDGDVERDELVALISDQVAAKTGRETEPVEGALTDLCAAMGFETASLFVARGAAGWSLASRVGPERPWHSVIDGAVAGPIGAGVVFADARSLPGVGSRLAGLGCGGIAVLPVPGGARVVLDAASVRRGTPSVEHAEPFLAELGRRARGLRESEISSLERVVAAVRGVLEADRADVSDLLEAVRLAVRADELFHLVERGDDVEVSRQPAGAWPQRIPSEIRSSMRSLPSFGPLDDASARQLGLVLGATSSHLAAAFGRDDHPQEVLVAGWRRGSGLSPETLRVVAQVIGSARAVLEANREALESRLSKQRHRWAYEIHDGVTQAVTTAVLELEALGRQIETDPQAAVKVLATTRAEIRKSLSELREILRDLTQDDGPEVKLDEPLSKYVHGVIERWRLPATVAIEGDLRPVPKNLLGVAYVVIREALANAAKHAGGGTVAVTIRVTKADLTVEVRDTGRGFRRGGADAEGPRRNFGLDMIEKRVAEVGGTVSVESAPGEGTCLVARLPVGEGNP